MLKLDLWGQKGATPEFMMVGNLRIELALGVENFFVPEVLVNRRLVGFCFSWPAGSAAYLGGLGALNYRLFFLIDLLLLLLLDVINLVPEVDVLDFFR